MKTIIFFIALSLLFSCNSKSANDEKMKKAVEQYFSFVEKNMKKETPGLFRESDIYSGVIESDAWFLNKHYAKLDIKNRLKNMKVKDTTSIIPDWKEKYIQFYIKNGDDRLPLIITFTFDDLSGPEKFTSPNILENRVYWNKSLDSLRKKGIFPTQK